MLTLEWNAVRVGHLLAAHDDSKPSVPLRTGPVVLIQPAGRTQEVAIRVPTDDGGTTVIRPQRLATHRVPIDPTESCWRCDTIAAGQSKTGAAR